MLSMPDKFKVRTQVRKTTTFKSQETKIRYSTTSPVPAATLYI